MPGLHLVLGLLAAVAAFAALGRRVGVPGPIVFALGGLALALVPGLPLVALPPELVLLVFLPPLIFAAAQETTWGEVRVLARPILLLAVGLVAATTAAVAAVAHALIPGFSWAEAFTMGAVVAPPDAVAAKAVAERLRLPPRMVAVLEGEGLFNDATALVLFQLASAAALTGARVAPGPAALRLGAAVAVAAAVGVLVGAAGRFVLDRVGDPPAEATVTLLLPFAAYLAAEHWHGSGVIAVIAVALTLNQPSRWFRGESPLGRAHTQALWATLDFLLTGLSFVLVGLQLRFVMRGPRGEAWPPLVALAAAGVVCFTVIGVRLAWMFGTAWALGRPGPGAARPDWRTLVVSGWAGMRGVVSLAIALSLPVTTASGAPFRAREAIVLFTFVVIFATLVGQGLTLPLLIRRVGLGRADEAHPPGPAPVPASAEPR